MWVRSLGWEDPLEEEIKTHSYILAWRIPMDRGTWRATDHGVTKSRTGLSTHAPFIEHYMSESVSGTCHTSILILKIFNNQCFYPDVTDRSTDAQKVQRKGQWSHS